MRLVEKVVLGGGLAGTATALGIAVAGIATTTAVVVTGPLAAPAGAEALKPFTGCDQLRTWYVDRAVREVGPYGWGGGPIYAYDDLMRGSTVPLNGTTDARAPLASVAGSATGAGKSQASSETGTNVQEAGVDEPDIAKTDGKRVVRIVTNDQNGRSSVVVSDVTGDRPVELGRLPLPENVYGGELLLSGDHALVVAGGGGWAEPMGDVLFRSDMKAPMQTGSRLLDVDLSDPAHPRLAHVDSYDGTIVSARLYGDTVRVVTSMPRPELRWTYPERGVSEHTATLRNRALVRRTTIEDWLPSVTSNGQRTPLVRCDQVLHPPTPGGLETLTVTTFGIDDLEDRTSVGVTADGQIVYSSTDRLYVATVRMDEPARVGSPLEARPLIRPLDVKTDLHAFALDGRKTTYVASGTVDGSLRDRWSMDSYDGVLRVAWTRETWNKGGNPGTVRNGLTTFTEQDGRLVRQGEIGDLGIDENIQSVRWFDDLAVLVTFRQMDPLYTIDLTDPAHPRTLGALKIPGYSGYLHPIGDHELLGLGVDATTEGRRMGSQAAVFDIADLRRPRQTGKVGLGANTDLPAMSDPRSFTWLPDAGTGLTTVTDWNDGHARLVALKVAASGAISSRDLADDLQGGWQTRTLPLPDGRVVVADKDLRILELN